MWEIRKRKRGKKRIPLLLVAALALSLGGCGSKVEERPPWEEQGLRSAIHGLSAEAIQDNSLDAYSRTQDVPLRPQGSEETGESGLHSVFLGASRAYYFKKHLLDSAEESWDELAFADAEGKTGSLRFEWGRLSWKDQLWSAGPVAGSDHYLALNVESLKEDTYLYSLSERDGADQVIRTIPLTVPKESDFVSVLDKIAFYAMDGTGTVHLVWHMPEGWDYQLISPKGELLAEYRPNGEEILSLIPLPDGRVAYRIRRGLNGDGANLSLQCLDPESGQPVQLAACDASAYSCTLFEGDRLLYADADGIYLSGAPGQDPQPLYLWTNHGIHVQNVPLLQADGDEGIRLVYQEGEEYRYLCLSPTTKEVEICEITLAVNSYSEPEFAPLVVEFNKKYPGCHINIESGYDYGDTALLTELNAGKGPVLLEAALAGSFQEQEKLWQPLDDMMDELGLSQALVPAVREAGRIHGIQYGIATKFTLRTLLTAGPQRQDWDYDAFIKSVMERPEPIYAMGNGCGSAFLMNMFVNGREDSYFWDAKEGTTDFDSAHFRNALKIAGEYVPSEPVPFEEIRKMLLDGEVLCEEYYLWSVRDIVSLRLEYGDRLSLSGYPTGDGARHIVETNSQLAVRRTASDREKLVAYAFLDMCLSYEGQCQAEKYNPVPRLSVREDVLKEELLHGEEEAEILLPGTGKSVSFWEQVDPEKDGRTLQDLLDRSIPYEPLPRELNDVLWEELDSYFDGTASQEQLIGNLESRIGLYFDERK